ncbi:MAG TPA: TIM barrel protein [Rhodothermales bacterium]|nr:TIM barrel protein [Rhodothermales bacterium]HRR09045.1 TIM barrel protein [Rhodothermales bacterium]
MQNRRTALKQSILLATAPLSVLDEGSPLKGRIRHSVCRWCYGQIPLDTFCSRIKALGLEAIDLVGEADWPVLKKHGLTCSMVNGAEISLTRGFNDPALHDELVRRYEDLIPKAAANGYKQVICFSGNQNSLSDEEGIRNMASGIRRLLPLAERAGITLVLEMLNSRVDHKGYQADTTEWGVAVCNQLEDHPNFKLLYDIYHMQIMEGDLIRTIRKHQKHLAHFHTGGNPGRNEINQTQEIYYPIIMKALVELGFKGYVAQEFIPKSKNPIASLQEGIRICDV